MSGVHPVPRIELQRVDVQSDPPVVVLLEGPANLVQELRDHIDGFVGEIVGRVVERLEVVVVRSDGAVLHTMKTKAQKGTPDSQRVLRLSDGTLVTRGSTRTTPTGPRK